jgi:glycosyltransferase involved in cell wall biosynthesis
LSRSLRILMVCHPRLDPVLGAAQIALELGSALRDRGHEVEVWTPEPFPKRRWRATWRVQNQRLEGYLASAPRFDVIDAPATSVTAAVAGRAFTVARGVQPEFAYQRADLVAELSTASPRLPAHFVRALRVRRALRAGWQRANAILCLGQLDREDMAARFPRWREKLHHYVLAPPPATREALLAVRSRRRPVDAPRRFLWLGRWAAHKGTHRLRELARELARRADARLTIAGFGNVPRGVLPREWGAGGLVDLVPAYSRGELPSLLERHDVGLFTSRAEGWGISLSEMLESGMTTYATHAGGVPDLTPYFPRTLRPLRAVNDYATAAPEDLHANGYLAAFSWPAVAERYETDVLGRV